MKSTGLPFACSRCGLRYGDGLGPAALRITGDSSMANVNLTVSGMRMQCPNCGEMNSPAIPDGEYNVRAGGPWQLVRRITEDLRSAQASADDFAHLRQLVQEALTQERAVDQVADAIQAETPFQRLAVTIRRNRVNVLTVLLTILLWLIPPPHDWPSSPAPSATVTQLQQMSPHELDELARETARQFDEQRSLGTRVGKPQRSGPARNKQCYCGSRLKYKKCHGSPERKTR